MLPSLLAIVALAAPPTPIDVGDRKQLFIDDRLQLPHWMEIHDLDDLKTKVIGVIIVLLGVIFLGHAIEWDGQRDILPLGIAVSLVMLALTALYFLGHRHRHAKAAPHGHQDHAQ